MANSLRATAQGLAIVNQARQRRGWTKTSTARWWQDAHTSRATLRRFWQGERIQQEIFIALCHAVGITQWETIADPCTPPDADLPHPTLHTPHLDLSEAPDVETFYGREPELQQLNQWITAEGCKCVSIVGMGGIGKTALALALTDSIQQTFDWVIWRSLLMAPSLAQLLEGLLFALDPSGVEQSRIQDYQHGMRQLKPHLQQHRCLIVLDGLDPVLQTQVAQDYTQFLQQWMGDRHQSCLLLTSREPLPVGDFSTAKCRCLTLQGLQTVHALELLQASGLAGKTLGRSTLVQLYRGNPLALKVALSLVQSVFGGNVTAFLSQNALVMGDRLQDTLQQQIERLTDLEREILYWLAIWQEPVSLCRLQTHLLSSDATAVLETISALERRSLLEKWFSTDAASFTLQPLLMQVVTNELVKQAVQEISQASQSADLCHFTVLRRHWLLRPGSDDLLGDRILTLLRSELWRRYGAALPQVLSDLLQRLQGHPPFAIGYTNSNITALLQHIALSPN